MRPLLERDLLLPSGYLVCSVITTLLFYFVGIKWLLHGLAEVSLAFRSLRSLLRI